VKQAILLNISSIDQQHKLVCVTGVLI